jgi:hypothetical protein
MGAQSNNQKKDIIACTPVFLGQNPIRHLKLFFKNINK